MKQFNWKETRWGAYTFAICSGVLLYICLQNLPMILKALGSFAGFCKPVFWGVAIAYIIDPLVRLLGRTVFSGIKSPAKRRTVSVVTGTLLVTLLIVLFFVTIIPQIVSSILSLVENFGTYASTLSSWLSQIDARNPDFDMSMVIERINSLLGELTRYISGNMGTVVTAIGSIGSSIVMWVISFILAIYCLADKKNLLTGIGHLCRALMSGKVYSCSAQLYHECNEILSQYIVFNLIDALFIGTANALFMSICQMPFIALISVAVAVTNLAPTFGPFVGGTIGAFILVLVNPWHALLFLIFTVCLQIVDGYIVKPRLFGTALAVPSVWILISIVVGGRMFGVIGVLLSIPFAAIVAYLLRGWMRDLEAKHRDKAGAGETGEAMKMEAPDPNMAADKAGRACKNMEK